MKFRKLAVSGWKSVLYSIAVLLLTQGANTIQHNDFFIGGAMCTIGFLLFLITNYFS